MFKCSKCIFYESGGYVDMGVHIPICKLKKVVELRKKNNNEKYDLFDSLIHDELNAEYCQYFTYDCEVVNMIIDKCNKDK